MTTGPEPVTGSPAGPRSSAVLREFDDYADAERVVDSLSDVGFPVEHVIVGTGTAPSHRSRSPWQLVRLPSTVPGAGP